MLGHVSLRLTASHESHLLHIYCKLHELFPGSLGENNLDEKKGGEKKNEKVKGDRARRRARHFFLYQNAKIFAVLDQSELMENDLHYNV